MTRLDLDAADKALLALALRKLHGQIINKLSARVARGSSLQKHVAARERTLRMADAIGHPIDDADDMKHIEAEMRRAVRRDRVA